MDGRFSRERVDWAAEQLRLPLVRLERASRGRRIAMTSIMSVRDPREQGSRLQKRLPRIAGNAAWLAYLCFSAEFSSFSPPRCTSLPMPDMVLHPARVT